MLVRLAPLLIGIQAPLAYNAFWSNSLTRQYLETSFVLNFKLYEQAN